MQDHNKETGLEENDRILTNQINTFSKELRPIKRLGQVSPEIWNQMLVSLWEEIIGKNNELMISLEKKKNWSLS